MDTGATPTLDHPMVAALDALTTAVDEVFAVAEWTQDTTVTAHTTQQLVGLQSRLSALTLRNLAHAGTVDVPGDTGASSTATWLAHTTRTTRPDAHRQTRLAAALASAKHACVRDALAAGVLLVEQARIITTAVDALPADLDADLVAKAEAWLVEQAGLFDAVKLRILGDRLLEVIAPDLADAEEARRLEAQERKAAQKTRLSMSSDGDGSVYVRATIPDLYAAMLKKILLAYAAPRHQAPTTEPGQTTRERKPSPERLGHAFCEFLESVTDRDVPEAGGTGATVVVTMDLDTLLGGLKAAHLDNGDLVSAATARRLACQAGLVPAVLGSPSVPWIWVVGLGSTPGPSGSRSPYATGAAPPTAVTGHRACARSTTTHPGTPAASPTSSTPGCSAPTTTPARMIRRTTSPSTPTAPSPSTAGRNPPGRLLLLSRSRAVPVLPARPEVVAA